MGAMRWAALNIIIKMHTSETNEKMDVVVNWPLEIIKVPFLCTDMLDLRRPFRRYRRTDDLVAIEIRATYKFPDAWFQCVAYNRMPIAYPADIWTGRRAPSAQPSADNFASTLCRRPA